MDEGSTPHQLFLSLRTKRGQRICTLYHTPSPYHDFIYVRSLFYNMNYTAINADTSSKKQEHGLTGMEISQHRYSTRYVIL